MAGKEAGMPQFNLSGLVRQDLLRTHIIIIKQNMPFKLRLIKHFQKCLRDTQDTLDSIPNEISPEGTQNQSKQTQNQKNTSRKRIVRKNYNLYQRTLIRQPLDQRHIANFFNIIGINEEAVRFNDCSQSYFRTLFYLKTVKKIEARPKYLLLHLVDASLSFPPINYIIQRFNSFGDYRFNNLASLIAQVTLRLKDLQAIRAQADREPGSQFLERYTQSLGSRMFVCRFSNNKMLISRSLLEALEYDPDEFALETLRFRTPIYEAASAERYYDVVVKFLENTINLLDLVCDRISLETFLDTSIMRFRDCFFTKKNRKLHCKIKTGLPHPLVTIFQIEQITSKSEEFQDNMFCSFQNSREVRMARQAIQQREISSVISLMNLPKNFKPEYSHQVASYTAIDPHC